MPSTQPAVRARRLSRPLVWTLGAGGIVAVSAAIWLATSSIGAGSSTAAPAESVLAADTRMGTVELSTRDLAPMRAFYSDAVGLDVLAETESSISLGAAGTELVRLTKSVSPAAGSSAAGLYHTAILFPDARSLAASLQSVAQRAPQLYQGSADHKVSLAFYFADPEGNGVELYVDRPESEWEWVDGRVTMGSDALDPSQFIADNLVGNGTAEEEPATVGHVHLKVGDLAAAQEFYVDALGFAVTSESDGAIFMSAGGYHHHLAANTWGSAGAGLRDGTLGLAEFTVVLADASELSAAAARLDSAGIDYVFEPESIAVDDPWGNTVRLTLSA